MKSRIALRRTLLAFGVLVVWLTLSVESTFAQTAENTAELTVIKSATPANGTDFSFTLEPAAKPILYREIFPLGDYSNVTQGARLNASDEGWRGYLGMA